MNHRSWGSSYAWLFYCVIVLLNSFSFWLYVYLLYGLPMMHYMHCIIRDIMMILYAILSLPLRQASSWLIKWFANLVCLAFVSQPCDCFLRTEIWMVLFVEVWVATWAPKGVSVIIIISLQNMKACQGKAYLALVKLSVLLYFIALKSAVMV